MAPPSVFRVDVVPGHGVFFGRAALSRRSRTVQENRPVYRDAEGGVRTEGSFLYTKVNAAGGPNQESRRGN